MFILNKLIPTIKKYWAFGFSFVLTKGAVYFVPLLLADILTTNDYGVLEYALAGLGFLVNSIINLGVPNAYPYFILRLNESNIENGFKLHPLWLLLLFLINQFAYFYFGLSFEIYLAFNMSYVIANQMLYSTILKSKEEPNKAIFLDSGIYLILLVSIVLFFLNILHISIETINTFILIYAGVFVSIAILRFVRINKQLVVKHYKKILAYSSNIMLGTFLIFMITTSGRILVEYFFGFEEVAVYGFYFRLAAIVVMIHQMINIVFFKKLYTVNPGLLDTYFSIFFICITILSYIVYLVSPFVLNYFSSFFNETFLTYKSVYFLLSLQMVMWIATALNSSIIDRENLAKQNNFKFVVLLLISVFFLWLLKDTMDLELLIFIHYTIIFIASLIQYYSLSKKQIYFKRSSIVLTSVYMLSMFYYILM